MTWELKHRRADGTFVIRLDGSPYHVEADDSLFPEVAAAAEGVILEPEPVPEAPPPTTPALTARQLRLWLLSRGITGSMVSGALLALPEPEREAAEIEWEYSTQYLRDHRLIDQIGAAFDLIPEQIDAAWATAAAL